jgi:hypothetical protein
MKAKLVNGYYLFERESKSEPTQYIISKNHGLITKVKADENMMDANLDELSRLGIKRVWYDEKEDKVYEAL